MGCHFLRPLGSALLILLSLSLIFVCGGFAQSSPAYLITTVAGSGPSDAPRGGFAGDGGLAANAVLDLPTSVAVGPTGDIYFSDWTARIRKIDFLTGVITTIAGTGVRGFAGDGGPASSALLGGPGNIATDGAGNIYFSDPYNHRVRRISAASGIITTIAGNGLVFDPPKKGPADDAPLAINVAVGDPSGLAADNKGGLYIANGSDRVLKVDLHSGVLTTAAGAGGSRYTGDYGPAVLAQIDQPSGVALDAAGNLYIAARGEHRIRRVDAATGIITTVAGTSFGTDSGLMGIVVYHGGFGGDGGPATSAILNDPLDVSIDGSGNIYISDTMNYRIRRIDVATGIIHTIAGTGIRGFSGDGGSAAGAQITTPAGLAVDFAGRVYFADESNQRVRALFPRQPSPRLTNGFRRRLDVP